MSQTVHFQGNPVTVANSIPQAGSKAQTFTLVAKDLSDVKMCIRDRSYLMPDERADLPSALFAC